MVIRKDLGSPCGHVTGGAVQGAGTSGTRVLALSAPTRMLPKAPGAQRAWGAFPLSGPDPESHVPTRDRWRTVSALAAGFPTWCPETPCLRFKSSSVP